MPQYYKVINFRVWNDDYNIVKVVGVSDNVITCLVIASTIWRTSFKSLYTPEEFKVLATEIPRTELALYLPYANPAFEEELRS